MEFIIILFLLILNGIFAMYEIALVSSSKARLETLVSKGNKSAKGVLKQLEEPEKFLSTIQIGITLIGIISGAYGGVAIADDVTPLFAMIPGLELYAKDLAMVTTVAVITYLSLIIGELVPKSMALNNPERYATLLSPFMIILTKVSPSLYQALGVFLPLITTNCCILGVAILVIQKDYDLLTGVVYAFSTAIGFGLALTLFAGLREQMSLVNVPKGMQGTPIALITAGLLAMAFMGFSGVVKL